MVDLVVATSILFVLTVGLTAAWWSWLSRAMTQKIDDASRRLKIDLIDSQSANLDKLVEHLKRLPKPVELDIAPLADRLLKLERAIASDARLAVERQEALHVQLDALAESIDNIPYPLGPQPVNLDPVYERFQSIDAQLASLGKLINLASSSDAQHVRR